MTTTETLSELNRIDVQLDKQLEEGIILCPEHELEKHNVDFARWDIWKQIRKKNTCAKQSNIIY